jgi:hypothetical protein
VRIDCAGKSARLSVKDEAGNTQVFHVKDTAQLVTQGGDATFSCGVQKPRKVTVAYKYSMPPVKGVAGEATGLSFE